MSELRASFAERDAYLDVLAQHYAEGRLDDAEFSARRDAIMAATTHREMQAQFRDLPASRQPEHTEPVPAPSQPPRQSRIGRRSLLLSGVAAIGAFGAADMVRRTMFVGPDGIPDAEAEAQVPEGAWRYDPGAAFASAWSAVQGVGASSISELAIHQGRVKGFALTDDGLNGWAFEVEQSGVESLQQKAVPTSVPPATDPEQVQYLLEQLPQHVTEAFGGFLGDVAMDVEMAFQGTTPVFRVQAWGEFSGTASWDLYGNLLSLKKDQ